MARINHRNCVLGEPRSEEIRRACVTNGESLCRSGYDSSEGGIKRLADRWPIYAPNIPDMPDALRRKSRSTSEELLFTTTGLTGCAQGAKPESRERACKRLLNRSEQISLSSCSVQISAMIRPAWTLRLPAPRSLQLVATVEG
jgi:hypothetical protein